MPAVANGISFQTAILLDTDSWAAAVWQPQSVMLIFSYFIIPQQLASSVQLTDWSLSMLVCYPAFSLIALSDNAIHKSFDNRLVREKIWRPRNNPATAASRRIRESEPPACSSCLHCSTILSVMLIFMYFSILQQLASSVRLTDWSL